MFAAGALQFAFEKATTEGKLTVGALAILSLFSWTIIITKFRQLLIARRWAKRFFAAYNASRDPLDIKRKAEDFEGAPAFQLYSRGLRQRSRRDCDRLQGNRLSVGIGVAFLEYRI